MRQADSRHVVLRGVQEEEGRPVLSRENLVGLRCSLILKKKKNLQQYAKELKFKYLQRFKQF